MEDEALKPNWSHLSANFRLRDNRRCVWSHRSSVGGQEDDSPLPPVHERLAHLRPSRELLEFYRQKIAQYDGENEELLQMLEKHRSIMDDQVGARTLGCVLTPAWQSYGTSCRLPAQTAVGAASAWRRGGRAAERPEWHAGLPVPGEGAVSAAVRRERPAEDQVGWSPSSGRFAQGSEVWRWRLTPGWKGCRHLLHITCRIRGFCWLHVWSEQTFADCLLFI